MKRGINKVTLMGNVGDDPKVNQINDTAKVARFPLATNEVYFDKEGNQVQKTVAATRYLRARKGQKGVPIMSSNERSPRATRRRFLQGAAAVAAFSVSRVGRGAGERLGVGFIGAGGRAGSHMQIVRRLRDQEKSPVDLVAACDIYRPRLQQRMKAFGIPKGYDDHRDLLADPKVDVVCIATPDHHHGYQAIDAIKAGKTSTARSRSPTGASST